MHPHNVVDIAKVGCEVQTYLESNTVWFLLDLVVDGSSFEQSDQTSGEFRCIDGQEEIPPNMPEP